MLDYLLVNSMAHQIIALLICAIPTYFICAIPFGLLMSKRRGVDIRTKGSGNIGSTNVARVLGKQDAGFTLLLDALKGFLCEALSLWILSFAVLHRSEAELYPPGELCWIGAFIVLAAVCGHVFSPYLHFKGGKGIAVGFGAVLALSWQLGLALLIVWALATVPSRYVSLGSICAALTLPFLAAFFYWPINWLFETPILATSAVVILAHRQNIERLRVGTEKQFSFAGSYPEELDKEGENDEY